jgi:hypothetical protein
MELAKIWHRSLTEAEGIVSCLPPSEAGTCVLEREGGLFRGGVEALKAALSVGGVRFHRGSIRGAVPSVLE